MKKLLYTLCAVALFSVSAVQAQYVAVSGVVENANGTNISINLTIDNNTTVYTTYSDSSGFFFDTIPASASQGIVFASFFDCNGVEQSYSQGFSPATMSVNFTLDWCPNTGGTDTTVITISGTLENTDGNPVTLTFLTDIYPNGVTADVSGAFTQNVLVNDITNPITVYFTDCHGDVQSTDINVVLGTVMAYYSADYCPDTTGPSTNCGQLFTATYNEADNAFTLTMDTNISALLYSYTWNFGDGTTSNEPYPSHTFSSDGIYNVCLYISAQNTVVCSYCHEIGIDSVGNPVTRTDAGFTLTVVPFGTTGANALVETGFDIYPNPVGNAATITLYTQNAAECTVHVFNATGQRVMNYNVNVEAGRNDVTVPMHDLTNGVYLMNVTMNGQTTSRSFVK